MKRIRRIGVFQTSKMMAVIYFFVIAIFLIPVSLVIPIFGKEMDLPITGGFFLVLLPIFYSIFGFFVTALFCLVYNVVAKYVGGMEIEVEFVEEPNLN